MFRNSLIIIAPELSDRTKRCLVDEDGGYRIFGGCLPADQKEITAVSVSLKQRGDSLYKGIHMISQIKHVERDEEMSLLF